MMEEIYLKKNLNIILKIQLKIQKIFIKIFLINIKIQIIYI